MTCLERSELKETPKCDRICNKLKGCGRHRCNIRCCAPENAEEAHLCRLICGRKLRCGKHRCEQLCHRGHCPPCLGKSHR
jgi:transcriptional repressor NF-X1